MNNRFLVVYGLFLFLAINFFSEINCNTEIQKKKIAQNPAKASIKKDQNIKINRQRASKPKIDVRQDAAKPGDDDKDKISVKDEKPAPPTDSQIDAGISLKEGDDTPTEKAQDVHTLQHPEEESDDQQDDVSNPDDQQTTDAEGDQESDDQGDDDSDQQNSDNQEPPAPTSDQESEAPTQSAPAPAPSPSQPQPQQPPQNSQSQPPQPQNCNPGLANCNGMQSAGVAPGVAAGGVPGVNALCNNQQNCGGAMPQFGMGSGLAQPAASMYGSQMCTGTGGFGAGCGQGYNQMSAGVGVMPVGMGAMAGCNGAAGGCMNGQMGGYGQYPPQQFSGGMGGYYNQYQTGMGGMTCPDYCLKRCTASCPKQCCKSQIAIRAGPTHASKKPAVFKAKKVLKKTPKH